MVVAQGLGDADRQAPWDKEGDRSPGTPVRRYGIKNPIFRPSPITPNYKDYLIFEGISVDDQGKQHYLGAQKAVA